MKITYDRKVDALYVELADRPVAYTKDLSCGPDYERGVDYDEDGAPVGVELLNASQGVDLSGIPRAREIAHELSRYQIRVLAPEDRS